VIFLVFGPPGCGKGTQAEFLAARFHIPAISTGEMIRAECRAGTALGRMAGSIVSNGGLVGDETVNEIVASRIARSPATSPRGRRNGRTAPAASFWTAIRERFRRPFIWRPCCAGALPEPVVIHLDVPGRVAVERLPARRQCRRCKHLYNLITQPPLQAGICDTDGATF